MSRTKPFSLRIDFDLYNQIKALSISLRRSYSDIVRDALLFFRWNPEKVLEFKEPSPDELALSELDREPMHSLDRIKRFGMSKRHEILWLSGKIRNSWGKFNATATSPWILHLLNALQMVLRLTDKERNKEALDYIVSSFPEKGTNLEEKIDHARSFLAGNNRVSTYYAEHIAECFQFLLKNEKLQFTSNELAEINRLLLPWGYWVGLRGLIHKPITQDVDVTSFIKWKSPEKKNFSISSNGISAEVYLSSESVGPLLSEKWGFSCGFTFPVCTQYVITLACNAESLYNLFQAVSLLKGKQIAAYGEWEVMKNDVENAFTITKQSVFFSLPQNLFYSFLQVLDELSKNENVQNDLIKDFIDKYGAL